MNQRETSPQMLSWGVAEVLFLGSLPFQDLDSAADWLKAYPLQISFRVQLPQRGNGWDMLSELGQELDDPLTMTGCVATKDQLIGPISYLGILGKSKEHARDYELALRCRIDALQKHVGGKIFFFDEPAMGMGLQSSGETLSWYREKIRELHSLGISCGIHCCQTPLNEEARRVFLEGDWDIFSLPLRAEHWDIFRKAYADGRVCCWGLSPKQLESPGAFAEKSLDGFSAELGMSKFEILQRTFLSSECGLGLLSVEEASRQTQSLFQLSELLRGFSNTR